MENISKKQKIMLLIAIIFLVFSGGMFLKSRNNLETLDQPDNKDFELVTKEDSLDSELEEEIDILVHITGAVNKPGLVELKNGDRLIDAIEKSGGFTGDADQDRLNLARKLTDEEKLYIPRIGEEIEEEEGNTKSSTSLINLNTASKEELMTLPGIGEVTAEKILNYRKENKFSSKEDIMNVSGIGEKKFEAIEEFITSK